MRDREPVAVPNPVIFSKVTLSRDPGTKQAKRVFICVYRLPSFPPIYWGSAPSYLGSMASSTQPKQFSSHQNFFPFLFLSKPFLFTFIKRETFSKVDFRIWNLTRRLLVRSLGVYNLVKGVFERSFLATRNRNLDNTRLTIQDNYHSRQLFFF